MSAAVRNALTKYGTPVKDQATKALTQSSKVAAEKYTKVMADNSQYVLKDPAQADSTLLKQYFFTKLSTLPKHYASAVAEVDVVKAKWAKRAELPMAEVGTAALFAGELICWFTLGEIIGRGGTLTGYYP